MPKPTDEVQINYELRLSSSADVLEKRDGMDFRLASHSTNGVIGSKAIQKALLSMRAPTCVELTCRQDYAAGEEGDARLGVPPGAEVVVKVQLLEIYEFEDAGKKAHWEDNLVMKKAIKPIRNRLCPTFDGTSCKVRLLSAKIGEEEKLSEELVVETTPGKAELCDALEAACARMRRGELALVTVKPEPSLHSPGLPNLEVPPDSDPVVYKLEMVEFGHPPPEEGPEASKELLDFCRKQKEKGSELFKAGRVRLAHERYSRCVELMPRYKRPLGATSAVEVFPDFLERRASEELKRTCRLNLAACALKLDYTYAATRYCDEVLKEEPKNVKALYRRAQGYLGSTEFDEAMKDCKRILELDQTNKEARLLMQKIKQAAQEEKKTQKEQFGASLVRKLA